VLIACCLLAGYVAEAVCARRPFSVKGWIMHLYFEKVLVGVLFLGQVQMQNIAGGTSRMLEPGCHFKGV
jgi:hypothetical protein